VKGAAVGRELEERTLERIALVGMKFGAPRLDCGDRGPSGGFRYELASNGESQEPGALVAWMRHPLDVTGSHEPINELGGGLLAHAEVVGQRCRGGVPIGATWISSVAR
jgi:hypothetical protein